MIIHDDDHLRVSDKGGIVIKVQGWLVSNTIGGDWVVSKIGEDNKAHETLFEALTSVLGTDCGAVAYSPPIPQTLRHYRRWPWQKQR